jgi:hypothetical protein
MLLGNMQGGSSSIKSIVEVLKQTSVELYSGLSLGK